MVPAEQLYRNHIGFAIWLSRRYQWLHHDHGALAGDALFGLWAAASSYDPDRGKTFKRYAEAKIRFAIADGLRQYGDVKKADWVSGNRTVVELWPFDHDGRAEYDQLLTDGPEPASADRRTAATVRVINRLPARWRLIVARRALAGHSQQRIADELGIDQTRVGQIWRQARERVAQQTLDTLARRDVY